MAVTVRRVGITFAWTMRKIARSIFDMVDIPGEYNYQPNRGAITKDTLPFYSTDQVTWHPVEEAEFDAVRASVEVPHRVRVGPAMGRARAAVHE